MQIQKCPTDVIKDRKIFPKFYENFLDCFQMNFVLRKKLDCWILATVEFAFIGICASVSFFFLQKQLVAQKIHIEENEDRDTGLEQRHNKEDPNCIKAKVPLGDLDLYDGTYITLESKDIR